MIIHIAALLQQLSAHFHHSPKRFPSTNWSQGAPVAIPITLFTCTYLDLETEFTSGLLHASWHQRLGTLTEMLTSLV